MSRAHTNRGSRLSMVLGVLTLCCTADDKPRGQLMIAMSTDMSIPKNMNQVSVEVLEEDGQRQVLTYPIRPADLGKPMPGTLAIVPPNAGGQTVRIRLMAERDRGSATPDVRVLRQALVKVPTDRTALVPMPLNWLCNDRFQQNDDGSYESDCSSKDETCVAGQCVDANLQLATLQTYIPELVFGGGDERGRGGHCIDVLQCFAQSTLVVPDESCTIAMPSDGDPTSFNLALVLPAGSDGQCSTGPEAHCLVVLDQDAREGYVRADGRVLLPSAVCDAIDAKRALGLSLTRTCPTKDPSVPICGPWTDVTQSSLMDFGVGGTSSDGSGGAGNGATGGGAGGTTNGSAGSGNSAGRAASSAGASSSAGGASAKGGATGSGGNGSGGKGVGTAGETSSEGGSAAVCEPACSYVKGTLDAALIDDLEDRNRAVSALGNRVGIWYSANDGSGTQFPAPSPTIPFAVSSTGCHNGSLGCASTNGSAFTRNALIGFEFLACACPYDGSVYSGIKFWAKGSAFRAHVKIPALEEVGIYNGACQPTTLLCNDHYGIDVPASDSWVQRTLDFATIKQADWQGMQVVAPFDRSQIMGVQFLAPVGEAFNFSIDDVTFY